MNNTRKTAMTFAKIGLITCGILLTGPIGHLMGQTTLNVPVDFATIRSAIQAAADGDTILVAPGFLPGKHFVSR